MHCHLQLEDGRTMQHPQNGRPLKQYLHSATTLHSIECGLAMDLMGMAVTLQSNALMAFAVMCSAFSPQDQPTGSPQDHKAVFS